MSCTGASAHSDYLLLAGGLIPQPYLQSKSRMGSPAPPAFFVFAKPCLNRGTPPVHIVAILVP